MHPEVKSDKPGLCPECGMQLLPQQKHDSRFVNHESHHAKRDGYDKHAGHSVNIFKVKFWVSLALTVPIVLYSEIAEKIGIALPTFTGSEWLAPMLGSVVFFYGGWVFLAGAYREIRARLPGMMTLIALAITAAYAYSIFVVFTGGAETLFWELSSLVTIMLLGHWIEMRAVSGATGALKELSKLLPDVAEVLITPTSQITSTKFQTNSNDQNSNFQTETKTVRIEELQAGDRILIKPGGKIPADGRVAEGESDVNESLLTGESRPVHKKKGDIVIGGALNGNGMLVVVIEKSGSDTFLAQVMRLVAEAQASKSRLQLLADRAALLLTVIALVSGGGTLALWLFSGAGIVFAMERLVAVLVVACPHALGLAVPLVASISTTKGAQKGILVKNRLALEAARKVDVVLFDKTGTLTKGAYGVTQVFPIEGISSEEVLQLAASVNYFSEHLIANALISEAKRREIRALPAEKFSRLPGKGVRAFISGEEVLVGSFKLLSEGTTRVPAALEEKFRALERQGETFNVVLKNGTFIGAVALADVVREESKEAVSRLKAEGLRVAMITGDSEEIAKRVSLELGVDEYFARVLPEDKEKKVSELQKRGLKVAMVGDGVNDAPALAAADVGIAIGAGTNVAVESAGIVLVRDDPRDVRKIIALSRATYRKMIQNLWWAAGYNIIAIPLAAGVLASRGIFLEPAVAAILMSLSTVIVALNALLLRRVLT